MQFIGDSSTVPQTCIDSDKYVVNETLTATVRGSASLKVHKVPEEVRDGHHVDDYEYEKQDTCELTDVVGYGLEDALEQGEPGDEVDQMERHEQLVVEES